MENTGRTPRAAAEAMNDLASSAASRDSFVRTFTLPGGYSLMSGLGNAALAYGVALGNSTWRFGSVAFVVGLTFEVIAQTVALRRFRTRNGASVRGANGFSGPRATRVVVALFLVALVSCIIVATWLMVSEHPFLSALVALTAIPATAIADRRWLARYQLTR